MDSSQTEAKNCSSWQLIPAKETELLSDIPYFPQLYVLFLLHTESSQLLKAANGFVLSLHCRMQSTQCATQYGSSLFPAHTLSTRFCQKKFHLGPNHMLHCSIPFITSLVSPEQCKPDLCKADADCFLF